VLIGGGVGDAYQRVEEKYGLARQALEIVEECAFPIHVLTKSCRVEQDLDVIEGINKKTGALVSMSLSTLDDNIASTFEPGCSPPSERVKTLSRFKKAGVATGIFLMPVIPFVTDSLESIGKVFDAATSADVDFIIFGGMTLKAGRQREHFMNVLNEFQPGLEPEYSMLYRDNRWGNASSEYYEAVNGAFLQVAANYKIPHRIPSRLYGDILDDNDRVVVMLEHLAYFHRTAGRSSPYRFAANSVSKLKEPLSSMRKELRKLNGVGAVTEKIIKEILDTGSCELLESFF
jgi:DNA repair photolyase